MTAKETKRVIIAGAGPAGLTAAYELCRRKAFPLVFEKNGIVGGISRTEQFQGYRLDIGGHRFFTKNALINRIWEQMLEERLLRVSRLSRIYYKERFFNYPLKIKNVIRGLGLWESFLILLSYLHAFLFPYPKEDSLEEWVCNRFGKRLYQTFFQTYTEKVWGIPCSQIRAEWVAQRIKGLSFRTALTNAILGSRNKNIKTLIDEFRYPALGPGMMWEEFQNHIINNGGQVNLNREVLKVRLQGNRVIGIEAGPLKQPEFVEGTDFIGSLPLTELIARIEPAPPAGVLEASRHLKYRDFLTVFLIVQHHDLFPDNWIYIHSKEVRMGRLQNYKNWSSQMVADPNKTGLGVEYFTNEDDELWCMRDEDLIELASKELEIVGLTRGARIEKGAVYREKKAYPVYNADYQKHINVIRQYLEGIENLHMVGRNGLHKYNNMDHSMLTALMAVENIYGANHDIWNVNSDSSYQEEIEAKE
jgi:protoporphyrinogen oxidase